MNNKKIAKAITKRLAQQKRQHVNKIVSNWKETKMKTIQNEIDRLAKYLNLLCINSATEERIVNVENKLSGLFDRGLNEGFDALLFKPTNKV